MKLIKLVTIAALSVGAAFAQYPTVSNPNPLVGPIYPSTWSSPQIESVYTINAAAATIASVNMTCFPNNFTGVAGQGQTAALTAPTGVVCPAGVYRISTSLIANSNGGGTQTPVITYHQAGTTQTLTLSAITVSTGNVLTSSSIIASDGSAQITFASTLSGTGNINGLVILERLQ